MNKMGNTASKIVADKERISLKEKIGYGFGDMASSMFWKLFGSYLMIFYTDVFGLPAAVVGTMFLITRVWDSAFDPIVGVVADRTHSRWGKFRPYLLYLAVPFALIGILTFTTPALSDTGKLIYAYVTYSLMMMVYSAINVPYGFSDDDIAGLLSEMVLCGDLRVFLSEVKVEKENILKTLRGTRDRAITIIEKNKKVDEVLLTRVKKIAKDFFGELITAITEEEIVNHIKNKLQNEINKVNKNFFKFRDDVEYPYPGYKASLGRRKYTK
jgi:hypothetical protein